MADGLQRFGTVNLHGGTGVGWRESPVGEVIAEQARQPGFEFLEPTEKLDMGVIPALHREMGGGESFWEPAAASLPSTR